MWVVPGQDRVALAVGQPDERPLHPDDRGVEARRSSGAARAAGRWPPGRCASGPCGACPATAPIRAASASSRFMWTSSRAGSQASVPASTSARRPSRPATSVSTSSGASSPARPRPADVGDRAGEVVEREGAVDVDRAGEVGHPLVRRALEPSAPEPHPTLRPVPSVARDEPRPRRASRGMVSAARSPLRARPSRRSVGNTTTAMRPATTASSAAIVKTTGAP